jgi:hypothetical protein
MRDGVVEFAQSMFGRVGAGRKDQHEKARLIHGRPNRLRPVQTGEAVARRHPDAYATGLQRAADRFGSDLILIRIGKKNIMRHGAAPAV